jgi:hypothetical protein
MCATVCPSQALSFGPSDAVAQQRTATPTRNFRFGNEDVRTKVFMMTPASAPVMVVDVEDYMEKPTDGPEAWLVDDADLG